MPKQQGPTTVQDMHVRTKPRRRKLPKRSESFSEWMARIDTEVEAAYRKVCAKPPADRLLSPEQRRFVEILVEHLRSLPPLGVDEDVYKKAEYIPSNRILTILFQAKYPHWTAQTGTGACDVGALPYYARKEFQRIIRGSGGRPLDELEQAEEDRDED